MADKVYIDNDEATEAWNGVLFDRWRDFRDVFVTALEGLSDDALASDPPQPGDRAIDLGCGFGETTLQIAGLVGPEGSAVGVDVADRFIDHSVTSGPRSISFDLGTQMVLKRASFAALGRLAVVSGIELPEAFAGVGDLPTGVHMTVGEALLGDTMAAVYKSKCCLVWFCNPAVTRIPDAHFFWEARYNGTEVVAISPWA